MSACPMCHGTDCQEQCAQGQCYFEEMQQREIEEERRRWEQEQMDEYFRRHPHG